MISTDIFDPEGGHDNAWARVPASVKIAIEVYQQCIQREVDKRNPGKYRPTSGWRSDSGNRNISRSDSGSRRASGVVDSRHLWGGARDFVPVDTNYRLPPVVCPSMFRVLRSPATGPFRCWHVEVI